MHMQKDRIHTLQTPQSTSEFGVLQKYQSNSACENRVFKMMKQDTIAKMKTTGQCPGNPQTQQSSITTKNISLQLLTPKGKKNTRALETSFETGRIFGCCFCFCFLFFVLVFVHWHFDCMLLITRFSIKGGLKNRWHFYFSHSPQTHVQQTLHSFVSICDYQHGEM